MTKKRVKAKVWSRESELHTEGKWVLEEEEQAEIASLEEKRKHEWMRTLQQVLENLCFTLSRAKPPMEIEVGRQRDRL